MSLFSLILLALCFKFSSQIERLTSLISDSGHFCCKLDSAREILLLCKRCLLIWTFWVLHNETGAMVEIFTKQLEFWKVWNEFWMIWIRDWIFSGLVLYKTSEPNWCFIFFVKLQIPAMKITCDWDFSGKFCLSNSTSCINRSIGAPDMHIRKTCQCDGKVENDE